MNLLVKKKNLDYKKKFSNRLSFLINFNKIKMYKTLQERIDDTYSCKYYQTYKNQEKTQEDEIKREQIENSYKYIREDEKRYFAVNNTQKINFLN